MRAPRMNDNPASSIAFWLAAEIMPASATIVTSARRWASIKERIVGSMVRVSARLPSNASTISGNPAWSVSSPMVICGSRRRSLENPGSRNPSPLSVSKYSVDTSYSTSDAGPSRACAAQAAATPLTPPGPGVDRQAPVHRRIRHRVDPDLLQHPQTVLLTGRLDDPGQHQLPEHHVTTGRLTESETVEPAAQRLPQVPHPGAGDLQRAARLRAVVQPQVQLALTGGQPLPRHGRQHRQPSLVVRGPDVLDIARAPPRGVHDLHRPRPRGRLHGAHVRRHGRQA